ncbi:MAG: HEAT repeat domain-containing protein [Gemmatimonadota bacterium]|nr:HEAT repeat domain-containing protein [Gemmatimonadota bacterium]
MPAKLAPSGPVTRNPAYEEKVRTEVKAPAGFAVTLFAEPPFAEYPVCVTSSIDGVVFVGTDPNLAQDFVKGRGRVVRLVDDNHDGRADRYTVFTDVDSPRGMVWDGKVLYVLHPPNLTAYFDDNGDGIADRSVDLIKGISAANLDFRSADHSTNGITLGIDGWIYIAVGDYGFVKAIGTDGMQLGHHGGGIVRVRTDGTGLEMYATGTRNMYDLGIDPFMHVFARDNTNDGGGWDTRMHYLPMGADMGYPSLFRNFASEHMPSIFDYGPGAGTGGLWVQSPGFPADMNNQFYSGDWTMNAIYRHPMERKGASYVPKQETFLTITRPTDMAMDGRANMYVSSLSGGQFRYIGDSVGYIVRITNTAKTADAPPRIAGASATELIAALSSNANDVRLAAQRELLRQGSSAPTSAALERLMFDEKSSADTRVAALFTLEQLDGVRSHTALWRAERVPVLREAAIRALTDRRDELAGLTAALFVAALKDANPDVRVQAITSLVRLGATSSASALVPLMGDTDPAIAHLARQALISLDARDVALHALDTGSPAVQAGALQALERMHSPQTVEALMMRAASAKTFAARRPILDALARLYNVEATWTGDWWTTHPTTVGPYYAPQGWEESPRIRPVLVEALRQTKGADFTALAGDLALNGVLPTGAGPLLAALNAGDDPLRDTVIVSLIGHQQLDESFTPVLESLEKRPGAVHGAVAELVSAQTALPDNALPMLRRAALDPSLSGAARANALTAIARMTGPAAFTTAAETFARVNPAPGSDPAVEQAWRRFVGDRMQIQHVDDFIALAKGNDPEQRVLGFSVLAQLQRSTRGRNNTLATMFAAPLAKVTATIDNAWTDAAAAPTLVRAITIMKLEANYADQLKAYQARK